MTKLTDISQESSDSFNTDNEERRIRKFSKQMLKSSLFIGNFQEKRFVEPLNDYRDVIKISEDEEEFIENLLAVKKRCRGFYLDTKWIGITSPNTIGAPAGYNLWVNLKEEVFGSYWYTVKSVQFEENEICLNLEIVRPVSRERPSVHGISTQQIIEDISNNDVGQLGNRIGTHLKEQFIECFKLSNIKPAIIFVFVLLSALCTFLIQALKYLLEFSVKVLHEFSEIITACTPIIINLMTLIMNTINGFYTLIAVLWRDSRQPKVVNQNLYLTAPIKESQWGSYNTRRALPYRERDYIYQSGRTRSSVRITPLN